VKILIIFLLGAALSAQAPTVSNIEFYGLHKLSPQRLLHVMQVKPGDPLPHSKGDLEDALEKVPGVVDARVEAVCCEGGKTALFVGIEEKGAAHLGFRTPPEGDAALPPAIVDTYRQMLDAVRDAARRGSTGEDLTQGHALAADPDVRALQENFADFAEAHLAELRSVLRESADEEQRAMATAIIGYAPNKKEIVGDLEYAMQDSDESVRANAVRALNAVAVLARLHPDLGIRISPTWFVEMLNSVALGDRTRATTALVTLTDQNGAAALGDIRERALDSVAEMAQWRNLRYALPAFVLAGRIAGMSEADIQKAWTAGNRKQVVDKALATQRRKTAR